MGLLAKLFAGGPRVVEVDVASAAAAMQDPNVQVVDCRSEREWRSGHVKGSKLMPLGSIGDRMSELDAERPVIVVCRSGHRSSAAARQLMGAGFTDVKSLKGGINAWSRSGNKLVG
jgi:rhodanese-related sulfurtransferase